MSIRIIATGGTFDKHYNPIKGALDFTDTHLPQIIQQTRVTEPIAVEVACLIDSLDMTPAHRLDLLERCRVAREQSIVIIHGTDTMADTARVIGPAELPKTIVLTGAMIPFALAHSDALFNLGHALACAQLLPPGTYVAMNGVAHPWSTVNKNRERGVFES